MSVFNRSDLVPLWDRPPEFLPLRSPSGAHHWSYADVRAELVRASDTLDKASSERRVALLAHPALTHDAATDGLHAGIQMLLAGESADAHRHTPSALRIGLEATETVTLVDEEELVLGPLDVVLNPSGTWHGHREQGGTGAVWLDVVDLPLVAGLGGVLFEPTRAHRASGLLDPQLLPSTRRFAWAEMEPRLLSRTATSGVRSLVYGEGSVMATLAVTAHAIEDGATLELPPRTGGAIVLIARGSFETASGPVAESDVVALRSWTPLSLTSRSDPGFVIVVDTSPALRALGLYREESVE